MEDFKNKTKQQVNIKWRKLHNFATGIKIQNNLEV